ncbi:hypothetical protein AAHC03_09345 [Spirometra sp. Aus1]
MLAASPSSGAASASVAATAASSLWIAILIFLFARLLLPNGQFGWQSFIVFTELLVAGAAATPGLATVGNHNVYLDGMCKICLLQLRHREERGCRA